MLLYPVAPPEISRNKQTYISLFTSQRWPINQKYITRKRAPLTASTNVEGAFCLISSISLTIPACKASSCRKRRNFRKVKRKKLVLELLYLSIFFKGTERAQLRSHFALDVATTHLMIQKWEIVSKTFVFNSDLLVEFPRRYFLVQFSCPPPHFRRQLRKISKFRDFLGGQ